MKAAVYAAQYNGRWCWRISLDESLDTDRRYWSDKATALMMSGVMPLGAALRKAGQLQALTDKGTGAEELGAFAVSSYASDLAVHPLAVDKLADLLPGRSLLWEEFVSLLEHAGIPSAASVWKAYAQMCYLTGLVRISASVEEAEVPRLFGFGKRLAPVCRRCGSSGSAIRLSACEACGESECAYCEACLTMGRARHCAPLIVGLMRDVRADGAGFGGMSWDAGASAVSLAAADAASAVGARGAGGAEAHAAVGVRAAKGADAGNGDGDERPEEWTDTVPYVPLADWQLSPAQTEAALEGLRFLARVRQAKRPEGKRRGPHEFLIWAVTGAGKTEMMFPLVAEEMRRGRRVLIATPRRDVVLELLPRVKAAFPAFSVAALYGGSPHRWSTADITLATTHQLLRFEAAFDLVVLDEVDAFPYHNNPVLMFAARKAGKPDGSFVLLSATPPEALQRAARRGKLPCAKVPVRFHRRPLPVPVLYKPSRLLHLLRGSLERGAQVFVFVPQIARLEPELRRLRQALGAVCEPARIDATSSQDPDRQEKVLRFRSGEIRILLTTTILERGVTIPKSDVIVLDADSGLFDAAALVQMAGRAGRSAQDPDGRVAFLARTRTRAQVEAVRQIREMNQLARRKGYLATE